MFSIEILLNSRLSFYPKAFEMKFASPENRRTSTIRTSSHKFAHQMENILQWKFNFIVR